MDVKDINFFKFSIDSHDALNLKHNDQDPAIFTSKNIEIWLIENLAKFQLKGVRSIWIMLTMAHGDVLAILSKHEFYFHHAKDYNCTVVKWISTTESNNIPKYAFTTIGVGAAILSSDNKILLMRERRGIYLGWKFPGGLADPGENFSDAARRETREETAVECAIDGVLTIRHNHQYKWGCSDIYVVCVGRPINGDGSSDQNQPIPDPQEAADARWFSFEETKAFDTSMFHLTHHHVIDLVQQCRMTGIIVKEKNQEWKFAGRTRKFVNYEIDYSDCSKL